VRRDWLTRTPKWVLVAGFWLVQGIVLYVLQAFLYVSQAEVNGVVLIRDADGNLTGETTTRMLGEIPTWADYVDLATLPEFAWWMGGGIAVLTGAQALFLMPVRRPGMSRAGGKGLRSSLCVAGLTIAGLTLAAAMGIVGVLDEYGVVEDAMIDWIPGSPWTVMGAVVLTSWAVATPLLIAFVRAGRKETFLARLSRRLLIGTVVETALLIPLDVMVRRKTNCYCWAGTYWGLTLCGAIGVFALGPAVFLPVLARRRATWYGGHCGVCGYDMTGDMKAARCPECGTGWRA
jgi:hypothetical protein